jgi:hypothetical protein
MTIPIYAVALVFIVVFCFISDFRKERFHWITIAALISTFSFIICVATTNKKVQYAFLCFAVGGVYAATPLTLMSVPWIITNPAEKVSWLTRPSVSLTRSVARHLDRRGQRSRQQCLDLRLLPLAEEYCPALHPRIRHDYMLCVSCFRVSWKPF